MSALMTMLEQHGIEVKTHFVSIHKDPVQYALFVVDPTDNCRYWLPSGFVFEMQGYSELQIEPPEVNEYVGEDD